MMDSLLNEGVNKLTDEFKRSKNLNDNKDTVYLNNLMLLEIYWIKIRKLVIEHGKDILQKDDYSIYLKKTEKTIDKLSSINNKYVLKETVEINVCVDLKGAFVNYEIID